MALLVVCGLPATALLGSIIIPTFGWRPVFLIAGIGALVVWYLRKSMRESPRWLESKRRFAEAEELITQIEGESASHDLPPFGQTSRLLRGSRIVYRKAASRHCFSSALARLPGPGQGLSRSGISGPPVARRMAHENRSPPFRATCALPSGQTF
jgi:MFS family permease